MQILSLTSPPVESECKGEDGGAAAVAVDLGPGLERVLVHQTDVTLVKKGVFGLKGKKRNGMD